MLMSHSSIEARIKTRKKSFEVIFQLGIHLFNLLQKCRERWQHGNLINIGYLKYTEDLIKFDIRSGINWRCVQCVNETERLT